MIAVALFIGASLNEAHLVRKGRAVYILRWALFTASLNGHV